MSFLNNKAQAFSVFRLLIAVVLGLSTLAIIISTIFYFEDLKIQVSNERFLEGFRESLDALQEDSSGKTVVRENLLLDSGFALSKKYLVQGTGLSEDCLEFRAKPGPAITVDDKKVAVNQRVRIDVYYICFPSSSCTYGSTKCIISFGEKIE